MSIDNKQVKKLQKQLLQWYGKHRRVMPWRAPKGEMPDPYHVWLSEIMLQQTTVATVGPYFVKFVSKWPTVKALARAKLDDVLAAWAGLGYYARARNLHKCVQVIVKEYKGIFPSTEEALLELPGIGPYTAAAIAAIAFNRPAVAVDGNVERVVSRFFAVEEPLPASKETLRAHAASLAAGNPAPADFTQAFMELGATVCTPRNPRCGTCPWSASCAAYARNIMEELPRKTAKTKTPTLYGKVFWVQEKSGAFLIEKRQDKGLYEGMYQLPTTAWVKAQKEAKKLPAPFKEDLRFKPLNANVRHVFSHFNLILEIWAAYPSKSSKISKGIFVHPSQAEAYALPSLMQKVMKLCLKTA